MAALCARSPGREGLLAYPEGSEGVLRYPVTVVSGDTHDPASDYRRPAVTAPNASLETLSDTNATLGTLSHATQAIRGMMPVNAATSDRDETSSLSKMRRR